MPVHPQTDTKTHQVAQVTIFGGHGRDDDAKTKPQTSHQDNQERQGQRPGCELNIRAFQEKIEHKAQKENKLDGKAEQIRDDDRYGHHQPGKVDLVENGCVGDEGVGSVRQAG